MKKTIKKISILLFALLILIAPFKTASADTNHERIFMFPMIDYSAKNGVGIKIGTVVNTDKDGNWPSHSWSYASKLAESEIYEKLEMYESDGKTDSLKNVVVKDTPYYFIFPGISNNKEGNYRLTNKDYELSANIAEEAQQSLSSIIDFIIKESGEKELNDNAEKNRFLIKIAKMITLDSAQGSIDWNDSKFTVKKLASTDTVPKKMEPVDAGTTADDFIEITNTKNNSSIVVQYSWPKGYEDGQYAYDEVPRDCFPYTKEFTEYKITLSGIVYGALYASIVKGLYYPDASNAAVTKPSNGVIDNMFQAISTLISNLLTSAITLLGGETVEMLVFNKGTRAYNYFNGIMPTSWYNAASLFYWFALIIATLIMCGGVLALVVKRSKSAIIPSERVTLKESIWNYTLTIVMLFMYAPLFTITTSIALKAVEWLASIPSDSAIASLSTGKTIAGLIIPIIFATTTIKINIEYITRAIMATICYALAPIFISSYAISGRKATLFNAWLRQSLNTTFLQLFNAAVLSFLCSTVLKSYTTELQKLAILFSLIPLNQWFKNSLFNLQGFSIDNVSSAAHQGFTKTLSDTKKAAMVGVGTAVGVTGAALERSGYNTLTSLNDSKNNDKVKNNETQNKENNTLPTKDKDIVNKDNDLDRKRTEINAERRRNIGHIMSGIGSGLKTNSFTGTISAGFNASLDNAKADYTRSLRTPRRPIQPTINNENNNEK